MTQRQDIDQAFDVESEYRQIEAALLETARGRWFLAEHSRRSRRMESTALEQALAQLKSSLRDPPALLGRLQSELEGIGALLDDAKQKLLARDGARDITADDSSGPDSRPPAALLKAAEELHELVWSLQARDIDTEICERIGRQTAAIFALSSRQAEESRRAQRHAAALDMIADRVSAALRTILLEGTIDDQPEAAGQHKSTAA